MCTAIFFVANFHSSVNMPFAEARKDLLTFGISIFHLETETETADAILLTDECAVEETSTPIYLNLFPRSMQT